MASSAEFPRPPSSLAELERILAVAAYLVVRHGEAYTLVGPRRFDHKPRSNGTVHEERKERRFSALIAGLFRKALQ